MSEPISFFFFSSRRRHTRFDCDWSSDVCSSDLRRAHRRSECRLEGKIAVGDLLHADGVPRRRRQGEPAQSREVPAPSRSARELTATRSLRMLYRGAVDSLVLAAALLFCLAPASAEPRFSFATTPGKLPKDVVPK